jgi:hypothetical protein
MWVRAGQLGERERDGDTARVLECMEQCLSHAQTNYRKGVDPRCTPLRHASVRAYLD